jgi:hypothetical protein
MSFIFPTADDLADLESALSQDGPADPRDSVQSSAGGTDFPDEELGYCSDDDEERQFPRTLCDSPILGFTDESSDADDLRDESPTRNDKVMPWWLDLQLGCEPDASQAREEYQKQRRVREALAAKRFSPELRIRVPSQVCGFVG